MKFKRVSSAVIIAAASCCAAFDASAMMDEYISADGTILQRQATEEELNDARWALRRSEAWVREFEARSLRYRDRYTQGLQEISRRVDTSRPISDAWVHAQASAKIISEILCRGEPQRAVAQLPCIGHDAESVQGYTLALMLDFYPDSRRELHDELTKILEVRSDVLRNFYRSVDDIERDWDNMTPTNAREAARKALRWLETTTKAGRYYLREKLKYMGNPPYLSTKQYRSYKR